MPFATQSLSARHWTRPRGLPVIEPLEARAARYLQALKPTLRIFSADSPADRATTERVRQLLADSDYAPSRRELANLVGDDPAFVALFQAVGTLMALHHDDAHAGDFGSFFRSLAPGGNGWARHTQFSSWFEQLLAQPNPVTVLALIGPYLRQAAEDGRPAPWTAVVRDLISWGDPVRARWRRSFEGA
jgi:hypothetical protein